jgi:NAD(P)-dependent dehydrogenase (short-subunit alcohol dehydrogenase family)
MKKKAYGRLVNVSSAMGQHARMRNMSAAYRLSKDALNALTQMIADSIQAGDILVNSAHPGWVRTEMGGASAPRSVEQGADTIVWLATLPEGGPSGGFFEERKRIDW